MKTMTKLGTAMIFGEPITIFATTYANGKTPAILLQNADGAPYAHLSHNPEKPNLLAEGEVAIKAWAENASLIEPVLASGLLRDTGRRIYMPNVIAQIWEFTTPA